MLIRYSALTEQALVAADDQPGRRIARADAADVEAADAVFAAEEQLLEDRQLLVLP